MTREDDSSFRFTSVDLITFAWAKRKPLLIVSLIAAIVSIIVSFQIRELYKSTVVLFPAPNTSVSKSLLSNQYAGTQALLSFGEEEQAEQLLQILNSDQIRSRIIKKYDLMDHYGIKPNQKYKNTILVSKYNKLISFKRTKYMSVVIEVLDYDPKTAANIANDIANLVDTTMNNIQHDRAQLALKMVADQYTTLSNQIKSMEDSLDVIRSLGINDYESQAEVINTAYAKAILDGNARAENILKGQLNILSKYGGAYVSISDFLEYQKENLSDLKAKYAEAKVDAEQMLPHKYVIDAAYPAERKSYPKKSIVVLTSTISVFLFAYLILLIIDIIRKNYNKS